MQENILMSTAEREDGVKGERSKTGKVGIPRVVQVQSHRLAEFSSILYPWKRHGYNSFSIRIAEDILELQGSYFCSITAKIGFHATPNYFLQDGRASWLII